MKFIVDALLPRSLCGMLASHGHDAVHTLVEIDRLAVKPVA
ncbi:MAG: hypothetical protein AAB150_15580 [Pseudomonadota bacterium]